MILPTKRVPQDRALIAIGAQILAHLDEPKTVSRLWEEFKQIRGRSSAYSPVSFDWYVLSLAFLHCVGAIELHRGRIRKSAGK
jgi:hypothetical protein